MDPYVDVNEFKAWADIRNDDRTAELVGILEAAREQIDDFCHRSFDVVAEDAEPTERTYQASRDGRLVLVDDFAGTATATVDGSDIEVTAGPASWNRPHSRLYGKFGRCATVVVSATWGWPTQSARVVTASKMIGLKLWERRNSPYGVEGSPEIGYMRVTGVDRDVDQLLGPLVRLTHRTAL